MVSETRILPRLVSRMQRRRWCCAYLIPPPSPIETDVYLVEQLPNHLDERMHGLGGTIRHTARRRVLVHKTRDVGLHKQGGRKRRGPG